MVCVLRGSRTVNPVLQSRLLFESEPARTAFVAETRLCEEVHLNLAYRWFCRLGLDGEVPDHSTFSKNRHGRFRDCESAAKVVRDRGRQQKAPDGCAWK
jgi:hypothetical protein